MTLFHRKTTTLTVSIALVLTACYADSHPMDGAAGAEPHPDHTSASTVYGTDADVRFAEDLWDAIDDHGEWKMSSDPYPGRSPHGDFLRIASTFVRLQGRSFPVIVKDNFAGEEQDVREAPDEHLESVTVMLRRESGYSEEHGDWFFVKYSPEGSVADGPNGRPLAGRVRSCIECHDHAAGHDDLFHND